MIGIPDVTGLLLINRVASQPSISPNAMSIRIRSGISFAAIAIPAAPSGAQQTEKPWRSRRRVSTSRLISLSSTNRILYIGHLRIRWDGNVGCRRNEGRRTECIPLPPASEQRHPDRKAAATSDLTVDVNLTAHKLAELLT